MQGNTVPLHNIHPYIRRYGYLSLWLGCSLLIVIALYMQYQMDLIPCALCMTQRVFIISIGLVALAAWLHKATTRTGAILYPIAGMILAIIGGGFSSRHLWLQSLPADLIPACGPSLSYLIENVPLLEALSVLLQGDGNCAATVWSLLGLTVPGWTLVAFIGLFSLNGIILCLVLCRSGKK
ncbi:MAG: disulfide bond formation protein DsbB [Candidatus Endobugula sp.]